MKLLRLFIWFFVLGALATGAAFIYIDQKVGFDLLHGARSQNSIIFSDSVELNPSTMTDPARVRELLLRHRYRETSSRPNMQGDFRLSGATLEIFTRDFISAKQQQYAGTFKSVRLGARNAESIVLEPQLLSLLGQDAVRASSAFRLEDVPQIVIDAVLSIEDARFYEHFGLDPIGMLRALAANLGAGRIVQGGSTITQQLAKNLFLSRKRTISRKLLELLAAASLERRLSKPQILELYLNEVYLGQEGAVAIHGFAEAANTYFAKNLGDITLPEAALLAGIIKAPSLFSPRRNPKQARERRDVVLGAMFDRGVISESEYVSARKSKLNIVEAKVHSRHAPFFQVNLETELSALLGDEAGAGAGLRIYSTLDMDMQACAESAVKTGLSELEKKHRYLSRGGQSLEAGLVAIEPYSGKIRAWVGGVDYGKNQYDHVSQAQRQIGSTIKPFLYLTALDGSLNSYKNATAMSILSDEPLSIKSSAGKVWNPENFDQRFRGDVTLRHALEQSLNIPAIQVLERVGVQQFSHVLRDFRIASNIPAVPALALGSLDTSLLALTAAYGALANGGIWTFPRSFIAVRDQNDRLLIARELEERVVADERAVAVLNDILRGAVERGTGRAVRALGYAGPVAGKTGTSNESRDAWFVGFTPDMVAGVWTGFDDNRKFGLTGAGAAVPIWTKFMLCVSQFHQPQQFVIPQGVLLLDIDGLSGQTAGSRCPAENIVKELFVAGTEPQYICRKHHPAGDIDTRPLSEKREPRGSRGNFIDRLIDSIF